MVCDYIQENSNGRALSRKYVQKYPNGMYQIVILLDNTSNWAKLGRFVLKVTSYFANIVVKEEEILVRVNEYSEISTRLLINSPGVK